MSYNAFISYSHAADGKLAPAMQSALQRLAKPWYRLRTIRIFRDQTSLSANPALWPSIEKALTESEYFLLMASPEAAQSKWVRKEIDWWLNNRSVEKMLILLTDGALLWDETTNDFDWEQTTALAANLRGQFKNEPLYVDLRWAKKENQLSLRHSQFRAAVLDLAAPLHGQPKDELDGEDVRQHRRVRLWVQSAVSLLVILTLFSLLAAYIATQERNNAVSEELASKARLQLTIDPEQSLRFAIQAMDTSRTPGAEDILRKSLFESRLRAKIQIPNHTHAHPIWTVGFSSDSKHIVATNMENGTAKVLDMETLQSHTSRVHGKAFNNGDSVLMIGNDGKAELRNITTGTLLKLTDKLNDVNDAVLSPDGNFVFISGNDTAGRILNIATGMAVVLKENTERVSKAIFSPDSQLLITMDSSWRARLWNVRTSNFIRDLPGHISRLGRLEEVSVVQFSPDGNYIATACGFGIKYPAGCYLDQARTDFNGDGIAEFDGTVRIWKKSDGTFEIFRELTTENDRVYGLAFDPRSQLIATAGGDKLARVWSVETGKLIFPYKEHASWVWSAAFNPDSNFVVTTDSTGGTARVWDARSGKELLVLRGHQNFIGNAVFSPDGRFVLTIGNDGTARIWELNIGQIGKQTGPIVVNDIPEASVLEKIRQLSKATWNKAVSSRDRKLVVTFNDQELSYVTPQVWQAETGTLIRALESLDKDRYKDGILAATFSLDNQYLALAEYGNVVRVWQISTGTEIALIGHEHFVHHVAFSPRAECVATASNDEGTVRLWRTTTGDSLEVIPRRVGDITIAFDPSGRYLITRQGNELVRFYLSAGCASIEDIWNLARGYLEKSARQY